jgi:pimeloyl-ACP methyl ester carboxylesterase
MFIERTVKSLHPGGFHPIVYSEFEGDPARTVICVHGLARTGRDFDWLAESLAASGCRVICPDMPGRGRSPAFGNPAWYNYPQYLADMVALIAHLQVDKIDWVGTSMGGIIGMTLAAQKDHPIRKMVINDIGTFIPKEALERIKNYVSLNPSYITWDSYYEAFKKRMQPFGLQTEEEWNYLARVSAEQTIEGKYRLAYDPKVAFGLESSEHVTDMNLWPLWPQINVPMLLLRGANSDVLLADTLEQMLNGKDAKAVTFEGVGHAPALMNAEQIAVIKDFLTA